MEKITSNSQIERATAKILCGDEQGTGFYINESVLLTAWHVVSELDDGEIATIDGNNYDKSAILAKDLDSDVCLLKVQNTENILPLSPLIIAFNQECVSYGYPYLGDSDGDTFQGKVNKVKLDHHWDFSFASSNIQDQVYSYEGLSGAPVVSSGYVVGFVRIQSNESVCVVSVETIQELLSSTGVEVIPFVLNDSIPEQLSGNVLNSTPNYKAFDSLNQLLENESGWFYCCGSPGSGKTTFSAWYEPSSDNVKICGRYFTKIPYDDVPLSTRTSRNNLIDWIEKCCRENGVSVDILDSSEHKIQRLPLILEQLKNRMGGSNCVFIIDGVDEVTELEEFLGVLPIEIPSQVSIVLSGTSFDILPTRIKTKINESRTIEIEPLDIGQCETYVRKELIDKEIETEFIQRLALKSEGHPLYLRYLINYVNSETFSESEGSDWLNEIPTIQGDISIYYDSVWDKFFRDEGKLWIVLILSQVRGAIEQTELIGMLPDGVKHSFISNFSPINYLLKSEGAIELYHNSFKEYISNNCAAILPQANDSIFAFCSSNEEKYYSIENKLYHLLNSSNKVDSISSCNQDWADHCAINHVSPDTVLADVKSVIELTVDVNVPHEVIRLLLLLQRLEFRYNSVFADNATHIASALVSMGKIDAAMKYLIRDNTLLVGDEDGLYFLQILYEKGCIVEAQKLLEAFDRKFRKYLQDEYANTDEEGFSLQPILVNIKASALSVTSKGREAFLNCANSLDNLKNWKNLAERHGETEMAQTVHSVRQEGSSWMSAYMYRKANFFQPSGEVAAQFNLQIDETWCMPLAMSLVQFKELNVFSGVKIDSFEHYSDALAEIELLAETYGYDKDAHSLRTILLSLIDDSSNVELVERIIRDYLEVDGLLTSVRDSNGVDFNGYNAFNLYFENKCRGYTLTTSILPSLPEKSTRNSNWEDFFIGILGQVGFVEGILVKARLGSGAQNDIAINRIDELIELLDFELRERARWDRSYLLPESFLPFIYSRLTELICSECSDKVDTLIAHLLNADRKQLGLFSEGYRDVFYKVIETMLLKLGKDGRTIPLVNEVFTFVQSNVQNRWERTPELLRISEFYSLLECFDEADSVFEIMLKSSMGPSWYKEAQFELLNSTFALNCSKVDLKKHAHLFASILDEASGEMTFQRYVRYDKERFIGNLASRGLHAEAIEYLMFEVMPPPKTLIYNAEHIEVDALFPGMGYNTGANNISIENGVLKFLEACVDVDSKIRAAVAVSFILNSDVYRYSNDYGRVIIDSLNLMNEVHDRMPIYNELGGILGNPSFEESRGAFVSDLKQILNQEYYNELKVVCAEFDVELPSYEEQDMPDDVEHNADDKFSEFNNEYEKEPRTLSKDELVKLGVDSFQERISIWFSNWSTESNIAKGNLKELLESSEEIIESLKPSINKIDVDVWSVIDRLLWFFDGVITEDESDSIYAHISAHFDLLVHTSEECRNKYSWLLQESEVVNPNVAMTELMLILQSHPTNWVKSAATNVLLLLRRSQMELIVESSLKYLLKNRFEPSVSTCYKSLKSYALETPEELTQIINTKFPNLKEEIKEIGSLDVFFTFYDLSKILAEEGYESLHNEIVDILPASVEAKNEVIFEEEEFESIQWKLQWLNEKKLLDRDFCEMIVLLMSERLGELNIQSIQKSDAYLNRSYPDTPLVNGREEKIANGCLYKAIFKSISRDNIEELANTLLDD